MSNSLTVQADSKVISAQYAAILIAMLENSIGNLDKQQVIKDCRLQDLDLTAENSYISYEQFKRLIEKAIKLTGNHSLGLEYGKQLNLTSHGEMGILMMSCANLQEAMLLGVEYLATRNPFIVLSQQLVGDRIKISVQLKLFTGILKQFFVETTLASIHIMRHYLLGEKAGPCAVTLDYAASENKESYTEVFGVDLQINEKENAYLFPANELAITLPLANPLIRQNVEAQCKKRLKQLSSANDIVSRLQALLIARPSYFPSLDETAAKLFMSSRTLKRKLQQKDTSFQALLDNCRKELAMNYLSSSQMSMADIAELLDFSDASNFANAFRRWTGKNPSQFRDEKS